MVILAKSGAVMPPQAGAVFLVLGVAVAVMVAMGHLPLDWYGLGPHPKPPRLRRWWWQRQQAEAAAVPEPLGPPGPITPPKLLPPDQAAFEGSAGTWVAGNGKAHAVAVPDPAQRTGEYSAEYVAYLRGELASPIDGKRWPDRVRPWKDEHRARGGVCDIAKVLARGGQPNCGWAVPLRTMDTDHRDYEHLFCERRQDVVFGCHSCHMRATRIKRQRKQSIYQLWGMP